MIKKILAIVAAALCAGAIVELIPDPLLPMQPGRRQP